MAHDSQPMKRRILRVSAAAFALGVALTPAAARANTQASLYWKGEEAGIGYFWSKTDLFQAQDTAKDGLGVRITFVSSEYCGTCYNKSGNNTTKDCDFNWPAGTTVTWTMCLVDNGADVKCLQLPEHDKST